MPIYALNNLPKEEHNFDKVFESQTARNIEYDSDDDNEDSYRNEESGAGQPPRAEALRATLIAKQYAVHAEVLSSFL